MWTFEQRTMLLCACDREFREIQRALEYATAPPAKLMTRREAVRAELMQLLVGDPA